MTPDGSRSILNKTITDMHRSQIDAKSMMGDLSNHDGRSNLDKSRIRDSEVNRKEDEIAMSLQDSIYNMDDEGESVNASDYNRRPKVAKPVDGSVTPAAGPRYDTIPSVRPAAAVGGRGTRSS